METFVVTNQKGGTGKSTAAVGLGACLAMYHSARVLIVELDQQHSIGTWLVDPEGQKLNVEAAKGNNTETAVGLALAGDDAGARACIQNTKVSGLDALIATGDLDRAITNEELRAALAAVETFYDFVFLDLRRDVEESIVDISGIDCRAIVPVNSDSGMLDGLAKVVHDLKRNCEVWILKSLTVSGSRVDSIRDDIIAEYLPNVPCLSASLRKSVKVAEATWYGVPFPRFVPSANVSKDCRALSDELVSICKVNNTTKKGV